MERDKRTEGVWSERLCQWMMEEGRRKRRLRCCFYVAFSCLDLFLGPSDLSLGILIPSKSRSSHSYKTIRAESIRVCLLFRTPNVLLEWTPNTILRLSIRTSTRAVFEITWASVATYHSLPHGKWVASRNKSRPPESDFCSNSSNHIHQSLHRVGTYFLFL